MASEPITVGEVETPSNGARVGASGGGIIRGKGPPAVSPGDVFHDVRVQSDGTITIDAEDLFQALNNIIVELRAIRIGVALMNKQDPADLIELAKGLELEW